MTLDTTDTPAARSSLQSGTEAGLLDFTSYLGDKNYMRKSTAAALRTGVKKVLEVEEHADQVDLKSANVDDIVLRFRNRFRGELSEKSLLVYEQRFKQATEMYLKWLRNDPEWLGSRRATASGGNGQGTASKTRKVPETQADPPPVDLKERDISDREGISMITYPFPIRRGIQGRITLPEDLTGREATRIARFVETLVSDDDSEEAGL